MAGLTSTAWTILIVVELEANQNKSHAASVRHVHHTTSCQRVVSVCYELEMILRRRLLMLRSVDKREISEQAGSNSNLDMVAFQP